MENRIIRIRVKRIGTIRAAIEKALRDAGILYTPHYVTVQGDFLFDFSAEYFPQARAIFDKLKNDLEIDYEVETK